MDVSEETVKESTPEESADNNKTEGEINDSEAEGAVGGLWGGLPHEINSNGTRHQIPIRTKP